MSGFGLAPPCAKAAAGYACVVNAAATPACSGAGTLTCLTGRWYADLFNGADAMTNVSDLEMQQWMTPPSGREAILAILAPVKCLPV